MLLSMVLLSLGLQVMKMLPQLLTMVLLLSLQSVLLLLLLHMQA